MSLTPAEQKVRKLARVPGNCVCANCGTSKQFGFSTVCIKYFTFVCNDCKSSHQAISHRCKSLTMSSWTDQEVAELLSKGNDYARRTWLKNAPPIGSGGRPREGDHIDVFKRFVVDVYERKLYFGEDDGAPPTPNAAVGRAPQVATAIPLRMPPKGTGGTFAMPPAAPRVTPRAPDPAPIAVPPPAPPVADLLDFSSNTMSNPSGMTTSNNLFEANFDAFGTATAPPPSAAPLAPPAPVPTVTHDPFQPTPTPVPNTFAQTASSGSAFGFISESTANTLNQPAPTLPTAEKKPVMSNHSMSGGASSLISNMGVPAKANPPNMNMMMNSNTMQGFGMFPPHGNPMNMMMQSSNPMMQQQMMMPQQQQQQQLQQQFHPNGMNGMGMSSMNHNMGMGMMGMMNNNVGMNFGMMNNNTNMMGGNNPMMNPQQQSRMMNGQFGSGGQGSSSNMGGKSGNTTSSMNSLDMNLHSMNAWTSGGGGK